MGARGRRGWEERMDSGPRSCRLPAVTWSAGVEACARTPGRAGSPCPRAPSAGLPATPGSPPAAPGPWCCSCSVNSGRHCPLRGGKGRGDPGRPSSTGRSRAEGGHPGPRALVDCGPLKASLSSGSGAEGCTHGPHPGFRDCHPSSWLLAGSSGLCLRRKLEKLPGSSPRLLEGG